MERSPHLYMKSYAQPMVTSTSFEKSIAKTLGALVEKSVESPRLKNRSMLSRMESTRLNPQTDTKEAALFD